MTYVPQYLSNLVPPIATTLPSDSAWQRAQNNHSEMFSDYNPPVAMWAGYPFATASISDEDMFRFRSRNGADFVVGGVGMRLSVDVVARRQNGAASPGVIALKGGVPMVQVNVTSTTFTSHTLTANPATSDEEWTISAIASAGDTVEISGMVAYWVATAPGARAYPSGYRQVDAGWQTNDRPVSTELAARLLNGPVTVAKDRPVCVFCHLWRASTDDGSFSKSRVSDQDVIAWGALSNTSRVLVGRGRIPRADIRSRTYVVTYYLRSSTTATGSIAIGASTFPTSANAWQSFQVQLGPVDVDITASIDPLASNQWAYYESVQVWRQAD